MNDTETHTIVLLTNVRIFKPKILLYPTHIHRFEPQVVITNIFFHVASLRLYLDPHSSFINSAQYTQEIAMSAHQPTKPYARLHPKSLGTSNADLAMFRTATSITCPCLNPEMIPSAPANRISSGLIHLSVALGSTSMRMGYVGEFLSGGGKASNSLSATR
jgi:hypothetical protein